MSSKTTIQYFRDGKPIMNPSVNSLSGVSYFYTKGIDGQPRVPTKRLVELLAELGVTDPKGNFKVTLPNGVVLSAKVGALAERTATPKATKAPKAAKTAAIPTPLQAAAARLKAAERYSGPNKITITKDNAAAIVAATDAEIAAWETEVPAKPVTASRSSEVTPITKASQTRRTAKAS